MVKALINGIFKVVLSVASIFTAPISNLINNALPSVGNVVNSITSLLNLVIGVIPYFLYMIPPVTRTVIYFVITFWVAQQPVQLAFTGVMQILNLIKRINIFTGR